MSNHMAKVKEWIEIKEQSANANAEISGIALPENKSKKIRDAKNIEIIPDKNDIR